MTSEEKKLSFMKDTVTHSLPYYSTLAVLEHEKNSVTVLWIIFKRVQQKVRNLFLLSYISRSFQLNRRENMGSGYES